ncbi:MAG: ABC transporter ATP-binding protein [Bacillaceae bacterium]
MTAISTENVSYRVDHFQLDNICLSIPFGEITTIIGPNGSGKSTFLKIVAQLLPCKNGGICVNNKPLASYNKKEFARTISMLTQSKEGLPDMSVKELVSLGRTPHKGRFQHRITSEDKSIIDWALHVTDTFHLKERMFYQLSGGQQQKVRIAMALTQKTDILLLDEPTTYLDISHQMELMELLYKLNTEYNITIVMVLHDLQQAATYSDNLIVLKGGAVVKKGKPKEVVNSQFLKDVYNVNAKVIFDENYPIIIPNHIKGRNEK